MEPSTLNSDTRLPLRCKCVRWGPCVRQAPKHRPLQTTLWSALPFVRGTDLLDCGDRMWGHIVENGVELMECSWCAHQCPRGPGCFTAVLAGPGCLKLPTKIACVPTLIGAEGGLFNVPAWLISFRHYKGLSVLMTYTSSSLVWDGKWSKPGACVNGMRPQNASLHPIIC